MPDPSLPEDEANVRTLQRSLVELAFMADPEPMERDPVGFARGQGLPAADQAAFQRSKARLLAYRDMVRGSLAEPVEFTISVTLAFLEKEDAWEACLGCFLETRRVRSPFYREVAPAFVDWLASSGWGRERWPFLLPLAHFEVLQSLVFHHPEGNPPEGLHRQAEPGDRLVLEASAQLVSYAFAVHLATPEAPEPAPGPVHLAVYRGEGGEVDCKVLTPATAALLVRGQAQPIGEAVRSLGLGGPGEALGLLNELRAQGLLLGFQG